MIDFKRLERLIQQNQISEAISLLIASLFSVREFKLMEFAKQLQNSYHYMLEYAMTGNEDPNRKEMLADIKCDLYGILEETKSIVKNADNPALFFANRRLDKLQNKSFGDLLNDVVGKTAANALIKEAGVYNSESQKVLEEVSDIFFEKIFALPFHATKELELLKNYCLDDNNPLILRKYFISGLFLSLTQQFDRYKFLTIIDIYNNTSSEELAARSLVSILIALNLYRDKIIEDSKISQRLELWSDSIMNYARLRDTVMAFLKTMDTGRINDRLKKELIPGLQNINPEIIKKFGERYKHGDIEDLEYNPEWDELLKKSGLEKKLQEFAELQSEGADIMMMPFSQLKSFSFFNKMQHWFLPFDEENSNLISFREISNDTFSKILTLGTFCDSDKYSFALSLNSMPESNLSLLKSQLTQGEEQLKIENDELNLKRANPEFNSEATNFLRDLYRFFNLFRLKSQFVNPLIKPIDFAKLPFIGGLLRENEMMQMAAEFFFKRGYYQHALSLFRHLTSANPSPQIWDKIGFCLQSSGQPEEALVAYNHAEMYGNKNEWRLKMMAFCNMATGNYSEAFHIYKVLADENPDNLRLIYKAALTAFCSEEYRTAAELCYKYEYLSAGVIKVKHLLALSELLSGNSSKGKAILEKMILEEGIESDKNNYFILGTLELLNNNLKDALRLYLHLDGESGNDWLGKVKIELKALNLYDKNKEKIHLMNEYFKGEKL